MFKRNKANKAIAKVAGFIQELRDGIIENETIVDGLEDEIESIEVEIDNIEEETAVAKSLLSKLA